MLVPLLQERNFEHVKPYKMTTMSPNVTVATTNEISFTRRGKKIARINYDTGNYVMLLAWCNIVRDLKT